MTKASTVAEYLAKQPPLARAALERVRAAIRRALPGADEVISYAIPAYRLHGRVVIFFAGWKAHVAVYPATGSVATVFARQLAAYDVSKGTIRFPLTAPIPVRLIAGIARLRAREAADRAAATSPRRAPSGRARPKSARTTRTARVKPQRSRARR